MCENIIYVVVDASNFADGLCTYAIINVVLFIIILCSFIFKNCLSIQCFFFAPKEKLNEMWIFCSR